MDQQGPCLPLQAEFVRAFAEEWIAAWNSHDLERILTHYEDDVELRSPVASKLLGGDGRVRGKAGAAGVLRAGAEGVSASAV